MHIELLNFRSSKQMISVLTLLLVMHSCYLKDGEVTYRYENGNKSMEGSYKQGQRMGKWFWWHENGQIQGEGIYEAEEYRLMKYWDDGGNLLVEKGNGKITYWYDDQKT